MIRLTEKLQKHANWYLAGIFMFSIFLQCWLFHYLAFNSIVKSLVYYWPKISIAILISSFVLFSKSKWWTIVVSVLIDVWLLTELIYSRANSVFLDAYAMTMVENMNGFWDSIWAFIYWKDLLLLVPTLIAVVGVIVFNNPKREKWWYGVVCIVFAVGIHCMGVDAIYRKRYRGMLSQEIIKQRYTLNPFGQKIKYVVGASWIQDSTIREYIADLSVLHHFVLNMVDFVRLEDSDYVLPSEDEKRIIDGFVTPTHSDSIAPKNPLIICLIESFESWVISPEAMPNLHREITSNPHLLYCPNIKCQRRAGNSSDGQLIVNTGLLPLKQGAAVFRFPFNTYPSLSSLYDTSMGIFPHELGAWNQRYMNQSYEIDTAIVVGRSDKEIFSHVVRLSKEYDYILALTISTHAPHTEYADSSNLQIPDEFSKKSKDYIKSFNYFDEGLGILLDAWHNDERLQSSTIVITSDHSIFKQGTKEFGGEYEYMNEKLAQCPLIIISPTIEGNICLTNEYQQMDIYPTILDLIGCADSYYWKGFGVNLLDSAARENRPISEQEALVLSDEIIRADWFRDLQLGILN